ncbi:MAG: glycosyltransferase family 4 protein [Steroidobacteraceae bacterium]
MKILSLTYEYLPIGGGGSRVAAAINEELVRLGHQVTVLTSAMKGLPVNETVNGVVVHRAPCVRRHSHFTTAPELLTTLMPTYRHGSELIRADRPDVIHTHFILPSGVLACALSRRFRIPYLLTAHGSDVPGYNPDRFGLLHWLLRPIWRRILQRAAAVTSPSRFLASLLHNAGCRVPVTVVPNGHWPLRPLGEARRNRILLVSRLFPRKGIQHFIDAVSGMDSDWEMIVAGDGPYRAELEARARRVAPKVRFVGFVNPEALRILYESSRILVFPSIQENFPMVLLEAMDAGCAIVTTNAEGCAEVVGDAGIVLPKGDPIGIREALDRLLGDSALIEDLSARGIARAATLAWPKIVLQYHQLLEAAASTSFVQKRRSAARMPR